MIQYRVMDDVVKYLSREHMTELCVAAEFATQEFCNSVLDYITMLENKIRILERKNRELRGQIGRQVGQPKAGREGIA